MGNQLCSSGHRPLAAAEVYNRVHANSYIKVDIGGRKTGPRTVPTLKEYWS